MACSIIPSGVSLNIKLDPVSCTEIANLAKTSFTTIQPHTHLTSVCRTPICTIVEKREHSAPELFF